MRSHFLTPSSIYIVIQYSSLNNCSSKIRTHMDAARVFPCVVCTNKHLISKREKKRMLLKYIDGNMDVITHISEYYCLKEASTFNHFLMTRLQYKTLKYLRVILSIIRKLSVKLSIKIHTSTLYMCEPLTCKQRAHFLSISAKK